MYSRPKRVLFLLVFCLAALPVMQAQQNRTRQDQIQGQIGQDQIGEDQIDDPFQDTQPGPDRAYRVVSDDRDPRQRSTAPPSLTTDERLTILAAALDLRRHTDRRSDCSHFLHSVYERAGFPYTYASSTDLYAGTDEFRRVNTPQAGDLIVWRGHAGIVTNPARHAFFSLLRSGPGVDSYDSPYWRRRGHPRFFRYIKPSNGLHSTSLRSSDDY